MSRCPHGLGQRLVRNLTHRIGTERPASALEFEKTKVDQGVEHARAHLLPQRIAESLERLNGTRGTKHRSVVDNGTLVGWQSIKAGGNHGSQRVGQCSHIAAVGYQHGQFFEEQRVAARALVDSGDHRFVGLVANDCPAQTRGSYWPERFERQPNNSGTRAQRWPHQF